MSKRKQNSLDDLVQLIALLPWWACLGLAVVAYLGLHSFATSAPPVVTGMQEMPSLMATAWAKGMATVGQYVLPGACLVAAVTSAIARGKRQDR
jgi:restriction system protein